MFDQANQNERDRYLYHYTSWQAAVSQILPWRSLRLGPFEQTNDVTDFQHWTLSGTRSGPLKTPRTTQSPTALLMELKSCCNLAAFSTDHDCNPRDTNDRGWGSYPMWAHYGRSFTGMCLVFEKEALVTAAKASFESESIFIETGLVKYGLEGLSVACRYHLDDDDPPSIGGMTEHLREYRAELLFMKQKAWAYEREYRIVSLAKKPGAQLVGIADSLVGVIRGRKCPIGAEVLRTFEFKDLVIRKQLIQNELQRLY